jgi:hypothetical protein
VLIGESGSETELSGGRCRIEYIGDSKELRRTFGRCFEGIDGPPGAAASVSWRWGACALYESHMATSGTVTSRKNTPSGEGRLLRTIPTKEALATKDKS